MIARGLRSSSRLSENLRTFGRHAVRVRSYEDAPFSHLESYVPGDIGARIRKADLNSRPLLAIFRELGVRVARAQQSISAELANPQIAAALEVPVGSALLTLRRLVRDDAGRPVEWLLARYRPDRYEYRMDMQAHETKGEPNWLPAGVGAPGPAPLPARPRALPHPLRCGSLLSYWVYC